MADRLNIGIVGLGKGLQHAKICAALPGVHVKAISDVSPDLLATVASELGVRETYTDGYAMIDQADLDAVIIAVPNHLHADFSVRALQKGLHVLVEKPIASRVRDAETMLQASREADRILMVGLNQRFIPRHQTAWRYIQEGNLGTIYYAKTHWLRRAGTPWWYEAGGKGALSSDIAGGGALIDLGVHKLDLALFLMGFPEVVSVDGTTFRGLSEKEGRKRGIDFAVEDAGIALIRFQDNRALLLEASWAMHCKEPDRQETLLFGEKGGMRVAETLEVYSEVDGVQTNTPLETPHTKDDGGITGHFCRVVQNLEPPLIHAEQALTGLRIIEAIYESARTDKTVYF